MTTSLASAASDCGFTGNHALVTGGAGFIGSHLVDALVQANTVTVLDDRSSGSLSNVHPQVRFVEGDIRERETVAAILEDVDVVFHQAGQVSVEASIENPVESQSVNVGGTIELLDCARQADVRVVAASSAAVYGHPSSVPVRESARLRPTSPYGVDKLALDQYTRRFAELYGLPTVALRYFNVYGPRQSATSYSGVISTFLEQARRGDPLTVHGEGTQTRDFIHVSDVVRANIRAATTRYTGEAFNIGTGSKTSIDELADRIRQLVTADSDIVHVDGRRGDIEHSCAETEKAKTLLDFEPRVGLTEGLETLLPVGWTDKSTRSGQSDGSKSRTT